MIVGKSSPINESGSKEDSLRKNSRTNCRKIQITQVDKNVQARTKGRKTTRVTWGRMRLIWE